MEQMGDNQMMRTSQLRQPSRIPSPGKGLSEISDSQTNARSIPVHQSRMPPPSSLKHKSNSSSRVTSDGRRMNITERIVVAEPPSKRPTLVERAGAPIATAVPVASSKFQGVSLTSVKTMKSSRTNSFSSSSSSRPPTISSRNTSNGSFSSSVGGRPTSYHGNRPQTAGHTRSTSGLPRSRPATAMEVRSPKDDVSTSKDNMAWNVGERLDRMEGMYTDLKDTMEMTVSEKQNLEHEQALLRIKVAELENVRSQLSSSNVTLQTDLADVRSRSELLQQRLLTANANLDDQIRAHRMAIDDAERSQRKEMEKLRRDNSDEIDRLIRTHRDELRDLERKSALELEDRIRDLERRQDSTLEDEKNRRIREIQEFESRIAFESQNLDLKFQTKEREIQNMRGELENLRGDLDREQTLKATALTGLAEMKEKFQKTGAESSSTIQSLESTIASLRARILFLESGSKAQSDSFAEMESRLQEAVRSAEVSKKKLIKEETLRRILFNQVQELKGNIRVMCRIRPVPKGNEGEIAKVTYPDLDKEAKEVELLGKEEKSSLGTITRKTHAFSFDRVFGPESQNQEVFEEISQLVQSALDGYNVCIFCYGQTGSGKTHTMSSADGMIPRATQQIYQSATELQEKCWTYTMEGSFVEVYNEDIHDLLGDSKDFDKKKHEIRHDEKKKQTNVTGLQTVALDSPSAVESILKRADANRSVAATKSNERSSRSHSVFILRLVGKNSTTGETSEGTLNLVDLAGSERLKQSGAEGERMKETQNINKSLSCLGDVIAALGQGKEGAHIPYRNSKLTYLLQYSLGGNSKTLMFVMASPMEAHLTETITSLKFATKVHNTHIGTAKKSTKVRERSD